MTVKKRELLENIWRLLKPKFYNRITRVIVLFALPLIASSLWEPIVYGFVESFCKQILPENDCEIPELYEPVFGLILIVVALTYNTINRWPILKANSQESRLVITGLDISDALDSKEIFKILDKLRKSPELSDLKVPKGNIDSLRANLKLLKHKDNLMFTKVKAELLEGITELLNNSKKEVNIRELSNYIQTKITQNEKLFD